MRAGGTAMRQVLREDLAAVMFCPRYNDDPNRDIIG